MSGLGRKVKGLSTETLKNIFIVAMGVAFLIEVVAHVTGTLGLGDRITFLTVLVGSEVPLWFAQVLLWSRGESIFEAYERQIQGALRDLEALGFTLEFVRPIIEAMKSEAAKLTPADREKMQAVLYASAVVAFDKMRENLRHVSPEKVEAVLKRRLDGRKLWQENGGNEAPPTTSRKPS